MKYIVETVSLFRLRYIVEAENEGKAKTIVGLEEAKEFSQKWIGEEIVSSRKITDDEICTLFREDHPYLDHLTDDEIINYKYLDRLTDEKIQS